MECPCKNLNFCSIHVTHKSLIKQISTPLKTFFGCYESKQKSCVNISSRFQMAKASKKRFIWTDRQTKALLTVWGYRNRDLMRERRHSKICKELAEELKLLQVYVTPEQVQTKIKGMRTYYRSEKKFVDATGMHSEWPYYERVHNYLQDWPNHMSPDKQNPKFEFCSPNEDSKSSSSSCGEDNETRDCEVSTSHLNAPVDSRKSFVPPKIEERYSDDSTLLYNAQTVTPQPFRVPAEKEKSEEPEVIAKSSHPAKDTHYQDDAQIFGDFIASSIREFSKKEQQQQLKRALNRALLNFQDQQANQQLSFMMSQITE